jgi:hypothetical protein
MASSQLAVDFIENEINTFGFKTDDLTNKIVIAIVGEARHGKSTYLNIMVSKILGINISPFKSCGSHEHVTKGIQIFIAEQYVFIDCQGLMYHNSTNDGRILLFAYALADIIIVNGRSMNNTVLNMIQPIALFGNYMTQTKPKSRKPTLIFRILDHSDRTSGNINKIFENTFNKNIVDQYTSLKKTLDVIFEHIDVTHTGVLSDAELDLIESGNYLDLLINNNKNINASIEFIMSYVPQPHITIANLFEKIKQIKEDILSHNNVICMNNADVCVILREKDLNEYISSIKREYVCLTDDINVDGTNENYEAEITPKVNIANKIFDEFNEIYREIDPTIMEKYSVILRSFCYSKINCAINTVWKIIDDAFAKIDVNHIIAIQMTKYEKHIKNYPMISSRYNLINETTIQINNFLNEQMNKYYKNYSTVLIESYIERFAYFKDEFATFHGQNVKKINNVMFELIDYTTKINKHVIHNKINDIKDTFSPMLNFEENAIKKIKNEIKNNLKQIETNISLMKITQFEVSIEQVNIKYSESFIQFNMYAEEFDKINFNELFQGECQLYYQDIMYEIISSLINKEQLIDGVDAEKIALHNPFIEFYIFNRSIMRADVYCAMYTEYFTHQCIQIKEKIDNVVLVYPFTSIAKLFGEQCKLYPNVNRFSFNSVPIPSNLANREQVRKYFIQQEIMQELCKQELCKLY